jgi:hypothetical protein
VATFPGAGANSLGVKVELLSIVSAGVWTDITQYVRLRNPVTISGMGRADWTSTLQAATLTLTLDNRDGRFTPKLAAGAYFPNITRNTQIRVSVNATSVTGVGCTLPLNANTGFEANVTNWTAESGATIAQSAAQAHTGTKSMSLHGDGATANPQAEAEKDPVVPGVSYTASAWFFNTAIWASGVLTQINWYDSGNSFISSNNTASGSLPANTWTNVTVTATAPSNAAFATITARASGTPAAGNIFFVDDATLTGAASFRFFGEVAEWPPKWSTSGRDVWVDITAAGIWRRMSQLATTLGSAYTRYNSLTLTGSNAPRCYWPCEDGTGSGQLVSFDSVAGTANAVQSFVTGASGLSLAACTDFKGSDGIPQLNAAKITATVPAGGTATNNCTRFLISVPKAGDSASGTTNWNLAEVNSSGTVAKFEIYLNAAGTLLMQLRNSGGTVLASGTTTTNVKGVPVLASCELTPSGGNVAFAFRIITPGAAGITESMTGTITTASVGAITTVNFGRANVLMDTAVGHLSVTYGAVPLMVPAAYALGGYAGEFAMDRFTRICSEMGIAAETIGTASATAAMGPQVDDTLTNVLQSVEDTDLGLLFESRTQFGLGYRTLTSMANQAAAATISYTAARLDPSLAPAFDDSLTRNNVTITNQSTGYTQQAILTAGPMSISNPPAGIGNGYNYTRTVNAASDTQIAGIANWLLNVGSVDEIRFPVITVKMVRAENAGLFAAIPGIRPGDYLQITSPPAFLTASTVKQLAVGYTETIRGTPREWTFAFNAVPESPYETGFSPGTVQTAQLPGSGAVTSTAPGAGGLGGLLQNGSITPAMLNQGITIKTLGGTLTTISASAPATPNTGDIWIASATGLISQWNGSSWVPFKFDASATIQAGTIVASNIAASTITAGLLAAGIVVAGIVDATTVQALQFIASGTQGEFLAYAGTPGAATLATVISGRAGTDPYGTAFAEGVEVKQGGLILDNQGSAPSAVSGASLFYSSGGGRPRYLAQSGADLVLERSGVSTVQFNQGNTGTAANMSTAFSYLANEAQISSEYEIEVMGSMTPATTLANSTTFDWRLYMDGSNFGGGFTIGTAMFGTQTDHGYAFTIRFVITVQSTGAGGAVHVHSDGSLSGTTNPKTQDNSLDVGGDADNVAFDSTANHTFQLKAFFGSTQTGQGATTYRTKIVRRN